MRSFCLFPFKTNAAGIQENKSYHSKVIHCLVYIYWVYTASLSCCDSAGRVDILNVYIYFFILGRREKACLITGFL